MLPNTLKGKVDGSMPCFSSPLRTRRCVKTMADQAMYAAEPPTDVMYEKTSPVVTRMFMRDRNPQQQEVRMETYGTTSPKCFVSYCNCF